MIAVRRAENGHFVYHQHPEAEDAYFKQPVHKNAFEKFQQPKFRSNDYDRCLHYHTGYVIGDWAEELVSKEEREFSERAIGYNVEVIITPVFAPQKKEDEK